MAGGSSSEPWIWGLRSVTSILPVFSEDDYFWVFHVGFYQLVSGGGLGTEDDLFGIVTLCRLFWTYQFLVAQSHTILKNCSAEMDCLILGSGPSLA